MIKRKGHCSTCFWWGKLNYAENDVRGVPAGPFPDEKPAMACKRFPPTGLWGATPDAQAHYIGKSLKTFGDDFCGEWKARKT